MAPVPRAPVRCTRCTSIPWLLMLSPPLASALSPAAFDVSAALDAELSVLQRSGTLRVGQRRSHQPLIDQVLGAIVDSASANTTQPNATNPATESDRMGVWRNRYGDARVLLSTLLFSGVTSCVLGGAFCALRYLTPAVYQHAGARGLQGGAAAGGRSEEDGVPYELQEDAAQDEGPLDWLGRVWSATAEQEEEAAGLDGWSLLEFYRLNFRVFSVLGPVILAVLLPLHFAGSDTAITDSLSRFDIGQLPERSPSFWIHTAIVWLVVVGVGWYLVQLQRSFLARRFAWLKGLPAPRATTILIQGIPEDYRSDLALKEYFDHHFAGAFKAESMIERAWVVRRTDRLCDLVEDLKCVEGALDFAKVCDGSGRSKITPAGLEALEQRRRELTASIAEERARVRRGVEDKDAGVCSSSGFVTFSSEVVQRMAAREKYRYDRTQFVISAPPDPCDVNYEMLSHDSPTWEPVGWLCLLLLFVLWSPVVVFISSLTTLSRINEYVPLVARLCMRFPRLAAALEGILATAALKLFLAFLPTILLAIISRFFKVHSGALAQLRLERWYFAFLVIFVLFVTILGRSVVITVAQLFQHPTQLLDLLAASLPSASHFYFNYVIFGWLTVSFELLRFTNLLKYLWFRSVYSLEPQIAKAYCEPEDPSSYGMGARMALAVLMSAITFVFCTCSPLILVFSWMYFGMGRLAYGYLLVHVETRKPDLGGHFWVEALRQVFFILIVYVCLMTGILGTSSGFIGPPIAAAASLLPLLLLFRQFNQLGWNTLPLEEIVKTVTLRRADGDRYLVAREDGTLSEGADESAPEAVFELTPVDGAALLKSRFQTYVAADGSLCHSAATASKLVRTQCAGGEHTVELLGSVYTLQPSREKDKPHVGRYVQPECQE